MGEKNKSCQRALRVLLCAAPFMMGLYYELLCAVFALALLVWLAVYGRRHGLTLRRNMALTAVAVLFAAYLVTPLWAADHGLAVWGIAKILPLPLLAVCLMQLDGVQRRALLDDLPLTGCAMTVLSCVMQLVPPLAPYVTVNGRLAGLFQYTNTFACFLLLGLEVLIFREDTPAWKRIVQTALLTLGILLAGSRAVFLLAVPAVTVCLVCRKRGRVWAETLGGLAAGAAAGIGLSALTAQLAVRHLLDISVQASSLLGRLLYWQDALPVILRHPFGVGYMGYYFMQGSFQTGVYSTRWVHNDLLQLLLDVGWLPVAVCLAALWQALRSRYVQPQQKLVLLTLLAHAACDFDLEYTTMFCVLLLCLDWDSGKPLAWKRPAVWGAAAVLTAALSLWVGVSSLMTALGQDAAAVRVYPYNTLSQLRLLAQDSDVDAFAARNRSILRQNPYSAVAWNAQALTSWRQGDIEGMLEAKRRAIACNRYSLREYTGYIDRLLDSAYLYRQAGWEEDARRCVEAARQVPQLLAEVRRDTSPLAWRITDTPQLELPREYADKLAELS